MTRFKIVDNSNGSGLYEVHSATCGHIGKYIKEHLIMEHETFESDGNTAEEALAEMIQMWASNGDDFNGSESGSWQHLTKIMTCAKNKAPRSY
jgi:hypothetical protein